MTVQYVSEFAVNHIDDSKLTFWVSLKPKTFLISFKILGGGGGGGDKVHYGLCESINK